MVGVGSWVETERKDVKPFRLAQAPYFKVSY